MMRLLAMISAVSILSLGSMPAGAAATFTDDFTAGPSPLWGNEIGGWTATGGVYSATSPSNFPNAHSSLPFVLTDFSIDVDINNLEDGGIWLRSTAAPGTSVGRTGVLLVTVGTGLYWHIITDANTYGGIHGNVGGLFTPGVSDPHIRVEVAGDVYSAFVDGSTTAATQIVTTAFASGQVALYDFTNQTFDNVAVTPVPEPSRMILFAIGAVVVARWAARRTRRMPSR